MFTAVLQPNFGTCSLHVHMWYVEWFDWFFRLQTLTLGAYMNAACVPHQACKLEYWPVKLSGQFEFGSTSWKRMAIVAFLITMRKFIIFLEICHLQSSFLENQPDSDTLIRGGPIASETHGIGLENNARMIGSPRKNMVFPLYTHYIPVQHDTLLLGHEPMAQHWWRLQPTSTNFGQDGPPAQGIEDPQEILATPCSYKRKESAIVLLSPSEKCINVLYTVRMSCVVNPIPHLLSTVVGSKTKLSLCKPN